MIVLLKFHHFSLTGYNDKDRLRIYEGADESGLLTDSRHWAINYPYISSSNNLFLTFQSDSTGTSTGFKIEFTALSGKYLNAWLEILIAIMGGKHDVSVNAFKFMQNHP